MPVRSWAWSIRRLQPRIGCKVHLCTPCTSTTGTTSKKSEFSSLRASELLSSSAPSSALWLTISKPLRPHLSLSLSLSTPTPIAFSCPEIPPTYTHTHTLNSLSYSGRKAICLAFGVMYSISCLTKHSANFHYLMFGRILGGISTSILFSSFESWMVHEHHDVRSTSPPLPSPLPSLPSSLLSTAYFRYRPSFLASPTSPCICIWPRLALASGAVVLRSAFSVTVFSSHYVILMCMCACVRVCVRVSECVYVCVCMRARCVFACACT